MIYGYARCSTNESKQDINRQVRELKQAGAEEIFLEYEHGDSKVKAQQQMMFETAGARKERNGERKSEGSPDRQTPHNQR